MIMMMMRSVVWLLLLFGALVNAEILPMVVGGSDATAESASYMVRLQVEGYFRCGGTIISKNHILTAAHCIYLKDPAAYSILVGSKALHGNDSVKYLVEKLIVHDGFTRKTMNDDIALMKTIGEINFNEKTAPIFLSNSNAIFSSGTVVNVIGWGYTQERGEVSEILQTVQVPIMSHLMCQTFYASRRNVTKHMICAGYVPGGRDACQGDSGGPLVYDGIQIGIVSWGRGCARANSPGVYTNVAHYRDWIAQHASTNLEQWKRSEAI